MESIRIEDCENMNEDVSFEWEKKYFEKFNWLIEEEDYRYNYDNNTYKNTVLQFLSKHLKMDTDQNSVIHLNHPQDQPLYLYYVELENNKMILHATFQKKHSQILKECSELYEYAQINKPVKIVYVQRDVDFCEVDMSVKLFMYMFGIDDARGGSYKETVLPDYVVKTLEREFQIMNVDHYVKQEISLGL